MVITTHKACRRPKKPRRPHTRYCRELLESPLRCPYCAIYQDHLLRHPLWHTTARARAAIPHDLVVCGMADTGKLHAEHSRHTMSKATALTYCRLPYLGRVDLVDNPAILTWILKATPCKATKPKNTNHTMSLHSTKPHDGRSTWKDTISSLRFSIPL
jgi:hypothetical protein